MLLPLRHHGPPSLPPKALPGHSSPLFFYPQARTGTFLSQNPKSKKFVVRCSAATSHPLALSAIQRIADKLRSLGYVEEDSEQIVGPEAEINSVSGVSAGEIFLPLPEKLPTFRVGHTIDSSWTTPENPVPQPGSGGVISRINELRNEAKGQKKLLGKTEKEEAPTLAELTLSRAELRRLQTIGIRLKDKVKVGKAGVTEGIVNRIHERWRRSELVRIVCEDFCKMNMKRTHDLLEV